VRFNIERYRMQRQADANATIRLIATV